MNKCEMKIYDRVINQAAELAYKDDMDMIVGQDDSGSWVIRCAEDHWEGLKNAVRVRSDGIAHEYEEQAERTCTR